MPKWKDLLGGGKSGGGTSTGTSTSTTTVPEWYSQASQDIFNQAKGTMHGKPEERVYQGGRVAPLTNLQEQGLHKGMTSTGQYQPEAEEISNTYRKLLGENPMEVMSGKNNQNIEFNRFNGPNDALFNSYFQGLYEPAAERLNEEANKAIQDYRRRNASGSKFYSSNFGVGENSLEKNRLQALSQLQSDVLKEAMNVFQTEEGRNLASQQAQAGINQEDLVRGLQAQIANQSTQTANKGQNIDAAMNMMNNLLTKYNMNANDITRLLQAGEVQSDKQQRMIDAELQKFNEMSNFDRQELATILSFLTQIPSTESKTSSEQTSNTGRGGGSNILSTVLPLALSLAL